VKISLPTLLQQQLKAHKGKVIEIPNSNEKLKAYHSLPVNFEEIENLVQPFEFEESEGVLVAEHQGAHFYTIGQRKGLQIGGRPNPSFVVQVDVKNNLIFSGQTDEHLALNRWALFIRNEDIHYINENKKFVLNEIQELDIRIRYRQKLQRAKFLLKENGLYILFNNLQRGITPGQFAAWYSNDELIGSGVIFQ
jgi:tRNA-specific 2-thiouridylase